MKNKPPKQVPSYRIASVDHALALAVILQVEGPQTVSSAAGRLGVARSTAHRLLSMLVYRDFAIRQSDRTYAAGPVLSMAADSRSRAARLREVALPHLDALVARVQETVNLVIRNGVHTRFIASVECDRALRVGTREGMVFPAHATSGGQLLLADLSPAELRELYQTQWNSAESGEVPDLSVLLRRLARVRQRGFAINDEGTESGVTAVGYPIRDPTRQAEGAISISLPSFRFSQQRLPALLEALAGCARGIEQDLSPSAV